MTKQKIVMKVTMNNDQKIHKAMKIAAAFCGVESVAFLGRDKDQIAVTGEGIDSVKLACLLTKSVGHTEFVTVGPVKEENAAPDAAGKETKKTEPRFEYVYHLPPPPCYSYYGQFMPPCQVVHEVPYNSCNIM